MYRRCIPLLVIGFGCFTEDVPERPLNEFELMVRTWEYSNLSVSEDEVIDVSIHLTHPDGCFSIDSDAEATLDKFDLSLAEEGHVQVFPGEDPFCLRPYFDGKLPRSTFHNVRNGQLKVVSGDKEAVVVVDQLFALRGLRSERSDLVQSQTDPVLVAPDENVEFRWDGPGTLKATVYTFPDEGPCSETNYHGLPEVTIEGSKVTFVAPSVAYQCNWVLDIRPSISMNVLECRGVQSCRADFLEHQQYRVRSQ